MAPPEWRGALPLPYHLGPGPARVHLKLAFDWKLVPAYNVIARLRGSELPDQWIVRGNHHDAWVNGASDPVSGMVALMEEARAIGELAKTRLEAAAHDRLRRLGRRGARPARLDRMGGGPCARSSRRKAVAYINSDSNGRGFFGAGGSHSLERFVNELARDVQDPKKGISVGERAAGRRRSLDGRPEARTLARDSAGLRASRRSARAPTTRPSCSISASPRSTSASAARATTASTTRSTTRSITSCASWIPTSPTAWRWPRWADARCCGCPRPTCCRSSSSGSRRACRTTSSDAREAGRDDAQRHRRAQPPGRREGVRGGGQPLRHQRRAKEEGCRAGARRSRRSSTPARGCRWRRAASARQRARPWPPARRARCRGAGAGQRGDCYKAERALITRRGSAAPAVVQASGLRAGLLHGLRREDAAGCA